MYALSKQYPKRRAFVTGAGAGIGRALSEELAVDGWTIGIADIDVAALNALEVRIVSLGGKAVRCVLDVSDGAAYSRAAALFLLETGGIDLLINNAGIGDVQDFDICTNETWRRIDGINRLGVVHGCQAFLPTMRVQRAGSVINVASVAAFASPPGLTAYASSKAAVMALSESLYCELYPLGVRMSIAIPFIVVTDLFSYESRSAQSQQSAAQLKRWFGATPKATADVILRKAARGRLYIPTSWTAWLLFGFKRHAPQLFMQVQAQSAQKFNAKQRGSASIRSANSL